jgi:hypothetical protein
LNSAGDTGREGDVNPVDTDTDAAVVDGNDDGSSMLPILAAVIAIAVVGVVVVFLVYCARCRRRRRRRHGSYAYAQTSAEEDDEIWRDASAGALNDSAALIGFQQVEGEDRGGDNDFDRAGFDDAIFGKKSSQVGGGVGGSGKKGTRFRFDASHDSDEDDGNTGGVGDGGSGGGGGGTALIGERSGDDNAHRGVGGGGSGGGTDASDAARQATSLVDGLHDAMAMEGGTDGTEPGAVV